ncbi:MAG: DUF1292 domain-containing protein [Armatimonadetes bacterium]|nr:DUF1292 domain-containing protein [Armatimonadota bacterium]
MRRGRVGAASGMAWRPRCCSNPCSKTGAPHVVAPRAEAATSMSESEGPGRTLIFTDDVGREHRVTVVEYVELDDVQYVLVSESESADDSVGLLKSVDGTHFEPITDDMEIERVLDLFAEEGIYVELESDS